MKMKLIRRLELVGAQRESPYDVGVAHVRWDYLGARITGYSI